MRQRPFLLLASFLITLSLAGCCCQRASTSSASAGPSEPGPRIGDERQVFLDLTTVRIPESRIASLPEGTRPTAERGATALSAADAEKLLATWREDDDIHVLQAPKLLTLPGQQATIQIGESVRFARSEADTSSAVGGVIIDDPNGPVFLGYSLRATAMPDAAGTTISIELEERVRHAKATEAEALEAGVADAKAFREKYVLEQALDITFEVKDGGYVLIGSPEVHEGEDGRFIRVSIVRASVLDTTDAAGKIVG